MGIDQLQYLGIQTRDVTGTFGVLPNMDENILLQALDQQIVNLDRTLQTLRDQTDVDVLMKTIINYFQTEFNYSLIWIGFYDRLDHRLFGKGGVTPDGDLFLLKQRFNLQAGDLLEQVVIMLQPLTINNLQSETKIGDWRKIAKIYCLQGAILFPIRHKDTCFGIALLAKETSEINLSVAESAKLSLVLGELANTLHQIEIEWLRKQTKHADQPLLALLAQVDNLHTLDRALEAVVEETHNFIKPTRTNIYWFERERRYFWRRFSNRQQAPSLTAGYRPASGITVQELGGFYQALIDREVVTIGDGQSSLKTETTRRLMHQIRARSLLAAPIVVGGELLGFLAVEDSEPRIWQEDEKRYLQGVVQVCSLLVPYAQMEEQIQEAESDANLVVNLAKSIGYDLDWQITLKSTAQDILQRLNVKYFLLLMYNIEQNNWDVTYQYHVDNLFILETNLANISADEKKILEKNYGGYKIENWEEETLWNSWQKELGIIGIKSALFYGTEQIEGTIFNEMTMNGLLIIGHDIPRSWSQRECQLIQIISQQLNLILHYWQMQRELEKISQFGETTQLSLAVLSANKPGDKIEQSWTKMIADSLASPLVAVITWMSDTEMEQNVYFTSTHSEFSLQLETPHTIKSDTMIDRTLSTEGWLQELATNLSEKTQRWLQLPPESQVLLTALRTNTTEKADGIVIVADWQQRQWQARSLQFLTTLVIQLAWRRQHLANHKAWRTQLGDLENLNWYKQKRLEELYRRVSHTIKQANELTQGSSLTTGSEQKETLTNLRWQQLLRHLENGLNATTNLLLKEQWYLRCDLEIISISSLLRRLIDRCEPLLKKHKLKLEVERVSQLKVRGDNLKLELILAELLIMTCRRCKPESSIAITYQSLEKNWLELNINDSGLIDPQLLSDLPIAELIDLSLIPATLQNPPGRNINVCRRILQQMGGNLYIEQQDKTIITRLLLPLA